ncbi:MAG TPA: site-specific integrase [Bryobacteraceae bacterium]|nr:site-specific integrase [Bryobacteraceae bacterium]
MGLRIKNERWQYRFRVAGQTVQVCTGLVATERNKAKAARQEATHRQEILEGRWGITSLTPRTFETAVPDFEEFCKIEYTQHPATATRISVSMASCRAFFGNTIVSMIGPAQVNNYKVWRLTEHKVKPVTVKHDLDNLSVFFRWAIEQRYARQNPVAEVRKPSDSDAIRQHVLTPGEERLYFGTTLTRFTITEKGKASKHGPFPDLHDVARLILLQGMRPEEVLELRKDHVDLIGGVLVIAHGKTNAARRTLRLTAESKTILARRMSSDGRWVFPSQRRSGDHITKLNGPHNRVCEATGLSFVLYDLRHTFATRLAQAGVDAFTIAAILGHSSTRVLHRYIHPTQAHQDAAMTLYDTSLAAPGVVGRA